MIGRQDVTSPPMIDHRIPPPLAAAVAAAVVGPSQLHDEL